MSGIVAQLEAINTLDEMVKVANEAADTTHRITRAEVQSTLIAAVSTGAADAAQQAITTIRQLLLRGLQAAETDEQDDDEDEAEEQDEDEGAGGGGGTATASGTDGDGASDGQPPAKRVK